jgi:hypothetical protein
MGRNKGSCGLPPLSLTINNREPAGSIFATSRRVEEVEVMITKSIYGAAFAVGVVLLGSASIPAAAATRPPNCAAIAFKPMLARSGDGQQDAGLYKSRFGRIEVKAMVKDGVAQKYFVEINGKPLTPVPGPLPESLAACAKAKRLSPPTPSNIDCIGDQVTVLIDHSGDTRYVLLYVHHSGSWRFCSAGIS